MAGEEKEKEKEKAQGATSPPPPEGGKKLPATVVQVPLPIDVVVQIILIPFPSVSTPSAGVLGEVKKRCDDIYAKFAGEARKFAEERRLKLRKFEFVVVTKPRSQAGNEFGPCEFPVYLVKVDPKDSSRVQLGDVNKLVAPLGLAPFKEVDLSPHTHAAGFTRAQPPRKVTFIKHDVLVDPDDRRGTPQKRLTYAIVHEVIHAAGVGQRVATKFSKDPKYFPPSKTHGNDIWHDPSGMMSTDLIREEGEFVLPEDDRGIDFLNNLVILSTPTKKPG